MFTRRADTWVRPYITAINTRRADTWVRTYITAIDTRRADTWVRPYQQDTVYVVGHYYRLVGGDPGELGF